MKGLSAFTVQYRPQIYIPIWIDLKVKVNFISLCAVSLIYIPIWIDLKVPAMWEMKFNGVYLHSNMDRFERANATPERYMQLFIYIPIWIDLKVSAERIEHLVVQIYIPIWIDLKAGFTIFFNLFNIFTFQYG